MAKIIRSGDFWWKNVKNVCECCGCEWFLTDEAVKVIALTLGSYEGRTYKAFYLSIECPQCRTGKTLYKP